MADDKPEGKRLTKKQERLARARVKNPHDTLFAIGKKAGYTGPMSAWRAVNQPHVKARIRELLDESPHLRVPALLDKLEEGLEANETKFFAHEGRVVSKRTTVDYGTRHRYLETALELHGAKEKQGGDVVNNFFTKDAIEAFVEAFKRPLPPPNGHDTGHT